MTTILAIEDEKEQLSILNQLLSPEYNFIGLEEASDAGIISDLSQHRPQILILDKNLKKQSGIELIKQVRASQFSSLPIIVISGDCDDESLEEALNTGADDFITKPFTIKQLKPRIIVALRRSGSIKQDKVIRFKNLTIDIEKQKFYLDQTEVMFSPIEQHILINLVDKANSLVKRDSLIRSSSMTGYTKDLSLNVHIHSLRKKLGSLGKQITTIRNQGYILEEL